MAGATLKHVGRISSESDTESAAFSLCRRGRDELSQSHNKVDVSRALIDCTDRRFSDGQNLTESLLTVIVKLILVNAKI